MGYSTDFFGSLTPNRPVTNDERNFINALSNTRRMQRDVTKLMEIHKGKDGYPFAKEQTPEAIYGFLGEFYVGNKKDETILEANLASGEPNPYVLDANKKEGMVRNQKIKDEAKKRPLQPGLWCQWVIDEDGQLEWDGGEKFYNYIEWLQYLIETFFKPWNLIYNGEITWEGEGRGDLGKIVVTNNEIKVCEGYVAYAE